MNRLQPHPQNAAPPQRPILRAVMMSVALSLLGVALYIQTGSVIFLFGGVLIGAVAFYSTLKNRHQRQSSKIGGLQAAKPTAFKPSAPQNTSNVTPFRRPDSKPNKKSNSPFG